MQKKIGSAFSSVPPFSIIIPIHNESAILVKNIERLVEKLDAFKASYEVVLCENGSTDDTLSLARKLHKAHPQVKVESLPFPNYGMALKHAIRSCRYQHVVVFNIDFWNTRFSWMALRLLSHAELVVGSKTLSKSVDRRPFPRRLITRSFNFFLRLVFGFRGTDTHGMKAFRVGPLSPILDQCVTAGSIFDTELVLRAERYGLRIVEIPVRVREIRQPTYLSLAKRIPETVCNLTMLWLSLLSAPRKSAD